MTFTKYRSLEDQVVLISGGASGIGEAFVPSPTTARASLRAATPRRRGSCRLST